LLGSKEHLLKPHSWHKDFKTNFEWPKGTFFRDYDQEALGNDCDVKVPRELSRSHHILKVALAYYLAKEEKYAEFVVQQIDNWIDENPLMFSINWGCTMDVAIRAVNWVWILRFINDSDLLSKDLLKKISTSLYEHGWYIYRRPEKGLSYNHSHYLSDLAGQIYLGVLFQDMDEPKKWIEEGKNELFREMRLQILPSGMTYERSTNYNRLVLELFLASILLLKNNGHEIPSDIWHRLETMFDFLKESLKPDGTSPIIGDQDNGRLLPFGSEEGLDYRYLLSLGAVLFNRSDFKQFGNGFNIYSILLGPKNAKEIYDDLKIDNKHKLKSIAFKDAGLFIMRENDNYLIFNITGKGKYPEASHGAHTHSDLLSFELFTHGKTFLVDPGTFVYSADIEQRKLFRSTKMHNTVTIDDQSQNIIDEYSPWDFERNAIPSLEKWESNEKYDEIIASHNGYSRLHDPVIHKRKIRFEKSSELWIISDYFTGTGIHTFHFYFHFDTGIDFSIENNTVTTLCDDTKNIELQFSEVVGLVLDKEQSYVSKSYGKKDEAYVLVAKIKQEVPFVFKTIIKKSKS